MFCQNCGKRIIPLLFVLLLLSQTFILGGCGNKEEEVYYTVKFARNSPNPYSFGTHYLSYLETKVKSGEKISQPNNPSLMGYEFKGWFQESACINSWAFYTDTVSCDMVLYAKWEEA